MQKKKKKNTQQTKTKNKKKHRTDSLIALAQNFISHSPNIFQLNAYYCLNWVHSSSLW